MWKTKRAGDKQQNSKYQPRNKKMAELHISKKQRVGAAAAAVGEDISSFLAATSNRDNGDKASVSVNDKRMQPTLPIMTTTTATSSEDQRNLEMLVQGKSPAYNKTKNGAGGGNNQQLQRFYTVKTGIPLTQKEIRDLVYSVVSDHFEDSASPLIIIGGNYSTAWPNVRLTLRGGGGGGNGSSEDSENAKFFGIIFPSNLDDDSSSSSKKAQFTLRKGPATVNNDSLILFDETVVQGILAHSDEIFQYLKKIDGLKITDLSQIPKKPESWILEESQEGGNHLVLQIDDIMGLPANQLVVKPNVSLRVWRMKDNRKKKNEWYMSKAGVTMSAFSFFIFVEATLKTFFPDINHLVNSSFVTKFKTIAAKYDLKNNDQQMLPPTLPPTHHHSSSSTITDEYIPEEEDE